MLWLSLIPTPKFQRLSATLAAALTTLSALPWGCDGYAYAGGEAGQIYRIDLARREFEEFAQVDGFVGGICQDAQHRLYVCNGDVKRVEPDGAVSTYCDRAGEVPLTVANYPVFDAAGNLYVSNSGGWHKNDG